MKQLFQSMRTLLEGAPPLAFHAAAVFLKHEEPRWAQLAENADLLEERFYGFLTAPASWDLVIEHLNEGSWDDPWPKTPPQHTAKSVPLGYAGNRDKYKVCYDCDGSGIELGKRCVSCQGTGLVLKEGREDWKETRCELCKGQPGAMGSCRSCDGKGWFWLNQKTGEKDLNYGNPVKYGRVNEDAPANAAGNAGVAGIGQPPGSAFGEPGFALGGATTKTKKKNKRPDEDELDEEISDKDIETAAKAVHNRWVKNQKKAGETEHKSPDGKEDYMVPYDKLSDKSKEMDREAVRATLDTLKVDEAAYPAPISAKGDKWVKHGCTACRGKGHNQYGQDCTSCDTIGWYWFNQTLHQKTGITRIELAYGPDGRPGGKPAHINEETFAGAPVFDVPMDKWMASRFGKKRYHRYSRYVGNDELGETIRKHGRTTKDDIVLKDQTTGAMTYLRRKAPRTK